MYKMIHDYMNWEWIDNVSQGYIFSYTYIAHGRMVSEISWSDKKKKNDSMSPHIKSTYLQGGTENL